MHIEKHQISIVVVQFCLEEADQSLRGG